MPGDPDPVTYGEYLRLDAILAAQRPRSDDPNEWLFIIQHQTSELWMKLALIELDGACAAIRADRLPPAFKMLARVSRIMEQLVHAWDVLATMTPSEYSAIRPHLGTSSGFQSWQYRRIASPSMPASPPATAACRTPSTSRSSAPGWRCTGSPRRSGACMSSPRN